MDNIEKDGAKSDMEKKKKKKRTVSESLNSCVIRREEKIKRRGKNRDMWKRLDESRAFDKLRIPHSMISQITCV